MAVTIPGNASLFVQVVQTVKTNEFGLLSTTWTDITGMSLSITPSSASNKILLIVDAHLASQGGTTGQMIRINKNGSVIGNAVGYEAGFEGALAGGEPGRTSNNCVNYFYLDSPATTSAITYNIQMRNNNTGVTTYINRVVLDTGDSSRCRSASSITAIEVAYV